MATAGIRHYWGITVSLALGVAVATAVITGALLVGDSMRGSLRDLTLQRLGQIGYVVMPGGFFQPDGIFPDDQAPTAEPVVYFPRAVLETALDAGRSKSIRRAGGVQVIAIDSSFWELGNLQVRPQGHPDAQSVVLNEAAAAELRVQIGDRVTVRLPVEQAVPADSPLGRDDAVTEGLPRLEVIDILPAKGLGRFGLNPSQTEPQNVYLDRSVVTDLLARPGAANLLLIAADDEDASDLKTAQDRAQQLARQLDPTLADYGLQLTHVTKAFEEETIIDYYSLSSDRLMISDPMREAVTAALGDNQVAPVMTYLANKIVKLQPDGSTFGMVPYSTITAIDPQPNLPLDFELPQVSSSRDKEQVDAPENGQDVPVVLNDWAAERLEAKPGDRLRISYFEPEAESGREIERHFTATLTAIVPVTTPARPYRRSREAVFDQAPTRYNDPDLTPTVPGVTDQASISDWDLPFQLERDLITSEDDVYWNNFRLTPKAFIPLDAGRRLFGSRFGNTTSLRIAASAAPTVDALQQELTASLADHRRALGFDVIPIRAEQLSASAGTTPFDVLFLLLSLFVIFAALLLITLLMRLGLLSRAKEFGTLLATGWLPRDATRLATREMMAAAVPGALLGTVAGVAYAWAILGALRTLWVGAVTVPFLNFHWSWVSLIGGCLAGLLITYVTIRGTARQLRHTPAQALLAGNFDSPFAAGPRTAHRWLTPLSTIAALAGFGLAAGATQFSGQAQAGAFVGAGMLLLIASLMAIYDRLAQSRRHEPKRFRFSIGRFAASNARRNPLRSTLTIGLMAAACFLIVSMSAFQMRPTDVGVGGFDLIGQTAQPFYRDLADPQVQRELFGGRSALLADAQLVSVRSRLGQDASCNNLYQATQPTVLGMPTKLAELYEAKAMTPFAWAAHAEVDDGQSPWRILETAATGTADDPVPVVIDQATAMWALQMYGGVGEVRGFAFDDGKTRYFRVAGLLSNSVLQGRLMVGEANFTRLFPDISGDQFFLVATEEAKIGQVATLLENNLGDVGMDLSRSRVILGRLMAVQNTYLRTFQSLGALGLLLGTIGLAIAQLRSVLERRAEFAVLRAVGWTRGRLGRAVMTEHAVLLLLGIGCGLFAALFAVLPYSWLGRADLPLVEPLIWVAVIVAVGMLSGLVVLFRVARMPLVASLRS